MGALDVDEFAAVIGIRYGLADRPAGQDLGEIGDVVLRVGRAHAERVQFQDLARQILVEAAVAIDAGDRVGTDRLGVVEVQQHRRMAFGGEQHVGEAAEYMRADRLALIGAGHDGLFLVDAEMV